MCADVNAQDTVMRGSVHDFITATSSFMENKSYLNLLKNSFLGKFMSKFVAVL